MKVNVVTANINGKSSWQNKLPQPKKIIQKPFKKIKLFVLKMFIPLVIVVHICIFNFIINRKLKYKIYMDL